MRLKILFATYICILAVLSPLALAQDGNDAYAFLRFPTSTHVNALGGHTVSLIETDPSLIFHNPALLGGEMSGMLNVNYMNYIADVNVGSAVYTQSFRERSSIGVGITYINYGEMKETTAENIELGTFSFQDMGLHVFYEYNLTDKWRGGLTLKGLYSTVAEYSSFGLAADAGLSYYDSESEMSFGFVLKNIGAQLKSYNDIRQNIPWDIQMGLTRRVAHAPFRFSVTAMYLNRWKFDYLDNTDTATNDDFVETALKHFVFGLEFIPSENFWIGAGVNPKTMMDMKLASGNGLGGFSAGCGIKVSRFNIGASVARYHPSATSLMIGVTMSLSQTNL